MIEHDDRLCHAKQFLTLCQFRLICVDYNNHRIFRYHILHLRGSKKQIFIVCRIIPDTLIQRSDRTCDIVDHDMYFLLHNCSCTINTDCRSKRIYIPDLMSHDNDFVLRGNKLPQSLCLDSRLHTRILCHLFALSAKIRNIVRILYNRLVTSSCKCKIDCHPGIVVTLCISVGTHPKTDTECRRHLISNANALDLL